MKSKELKKLLMVQLGLKKPWFGQDPIELYDMEYHIPDFNWLDNEVSKALVRLESRGLIPSRDYAPNGRDCDNWALWIQSEVTIAWALQSDGVKALAFGFDVEKGHALNIGITNCGIGFWNYGVYNPEWQGKIIKVDFK